MAQTTSAAAYSSAAYHLKTLYLFTVSDFKTIIGPQFMFGVVGALCRTALTAHTTQASLASIASRFIPLFCWLWIALLVCDISNQCQPDSASEDKINKPWRPIPAGRLTMIQGRQLLLATIPVAFFVSVYLGVPNEMLRIFALSWLYNDVGGADYGVFTRNLINALAYWCFGAAALKIACGPEPCELTFQAYIWLTLISCVIITTIQVADLKDQEGDKARGRVTVPLTLGDDFARKSIAYPVLMWALAVPAFWGLGMTGYIIPLGFGALVAARVLFMRSVAEDKTTYKLWNLWVITLYFLPLLTRMRA